MIEVNRDGIAIGKGYDNRTVLLGRDGLESYSIRAFRPSYRASVMPRSAGSTLVSLAASNP